MALGGLKEFDEIEAMQGIAEIVGEWLEPFLAKAQYQDSVGNWVESTSPAVLLSRQDIPSPSYPRIFIDYQQEEQTSPKFETGLTDVINPEDPEQTLTVPYTTSYVRYTVTLTAESGSKDKVLRGDRLSSSRLLRKLKGCLSTPRLLTEFHERTGSTVQLFIDTNQADAFDETTYHDRSTILLVLDALDTKIDYKGGWFNIVNIDGTLYHVDDRDPNPISTQVTVGPVIQE